MPPARLPRPEVWAPSALRAGVAPSANAAQQVLDAQIARLEHEITDLKRNRNDLSPVSRIPAEILCEILLLATSLSANPDSGLVGQLRSDGYIRTMCHVSHSWRSIALGCAYLWAENDVGSAASEEQMNFLIDHGRSLPLSICINESPPEQIASGFAKPQEFNAIQRTLSGSGLSIHQLIVTGGPKLLADYLSTCPSNSALKVIQIFNTHVEYQGWWAGAEVMEIPQSTALFAGRMPHLGVLHLVGCALPLASPALSSPHLTRMTLNIPRGSDIWQVLDMLQQTTLLQSLKLNLPHDFQLPADIRPLVEVRLSELTKLVLAGEGAPISDILRKLRLPAKELYMALPSILPRWTEPIEAGISLLAVAGKARLPLVEAFSDGNELFSPNTLDMELLESTPSKESTLRVVTEYWKEPSSKDQLLSHTCIDIQMFDRSTGRVVDHNHWLPIFKPGGAERTGWSFANLRAFNIADLHNTLPSVSFWFGISNLSNLQHLSIAPIHLPNFLPSFTPETGDSEGDGDSLPFSHLRHIEITASSPCRDLENLLKRLVDILELRRDLALRSGEGCGGVLDSLSIMGYGMGLSTSFLDDIPPTLIKHVHREMIREC